jgi:pSer/pThr/pTyr-binding forkhead associated (FHA) protein
VPKLTLSFKGKTLRLIAIKEGTMTIGRDPACDIHIDSLALQPVHARLITNNDSSVLHNDSGEEGTFVNHKPVYEHKLADDDLIRLGKHVLTYHVEDIVTHEPGFVTEVAEPPPPPPAPSPKKKQTRGWLQILSGKNLGKTLKLKSGLTDLGKHGLQSALITRRSDGYHISKLGNDDITVGNNDIGEKSWLLRDGDMIRIGSTQMQFYTQNN